MQVVTPTSKATTPLRIDFLNLDDVMARHRIQYEKVGIRCIVEYPDNATSQLVERFHTGSNKIRFLRNAVLGKDWTTTSLKNICTSQYSFDQLVLAQNDSIQLEKGIK